MKIIQLCNLPIEEVCEKINQGVFIDRHNALYGYDFLKKQSIDVIPITKHRKTIWSKIINRLGYLIWKGHADYYLQILAMISAHRNKVDLVYCHYMNIAPLISFFRRIKLFKYPLLVIAHDSFTQSITSINTWKGIDRVLTVGERTLELCKTKKDLSHINCNYIDWGADLAICDNYYSEQKTSPYLKTIIASGVANRDYDTLVQAMEEIENIRLNILSSNCKLNINKPANVFINREMNRSSTKKLLPYYYHAIATAIPLNNKRDSVEGGTILMESMAMHKPVIITASRANLVNVRKENIGIEVDYHDVLGWKEAILYLINHTDEAREMGERAYYLAKTRYNYNNFCQQLLREILNYEKVYEN